MDMTFQPVFLKQSPGMICDQLLYLVKNSNLNFELHETPFSLNLNLKKSFTHHWNKANNKSPENNVYNSTLNSHRASHQLVNLLGFHQIHQDKLKTSTLVKSKFPSHSPTSLTK